MPSFQSRSSISLIADLPPACFAMVMATGIVSVAAQLEGLAWLAVVLLWLNLPLYALLWVLTLLRVILYPTRFRDDLLSHARCVGFFTTVAATCVLGNQFVVVVSVPVVAIGLWLFGALLWAVVTYAVLLLLTVKTTKPTLVKGLNGAWLVAVVATQAVAALGGLVAPHLTSGREFILFFAVSMWLSGGVLYVLIISLIFYRYTFFPLAAEQLSPPYWINMGTMAISTLAGTILIGNANNSPLLAELLPSLKGLTLTCWATATWWIPLLLLLLGAWRHLLQRVPLAYEVVYWSMVFPLGIYTAYTRRLSDVLAQPWLEVVPKFTVYVALIAWLATFTGLLRKAYLSLKAT